MARKDQLDEQACWALATRRPYGNLAGAARDGRPILRSLNHAVHEGGLFFHGAPRGEKLELIGQRVVFGVEHVIADVPSYWTDPRRACPATTFFESAQFSGTLERVSAPAVKAAAFRKLMKRLQPEGGYAPIDPGVPEYRAALHGVLVLRLVPQRVHGRMKVGQTKSAKALDSILAGLWNRGRSGDLAAFEQVLSACPQADRPSELRPGSGAEIVIAPTGALLAEALHLWRTSAPSLFDNDDARLHALRECNAWLGVRDLESGALLAFGSVVGDGETIAHLDCTTLSTSGPQAPIHRALLEALLVHPRVAAAHLQLVRARPSLARALMERKFKPCGGLAALDDLQLWSRVHPRQETSTARVEDRKQRSLDPQRRGEDR